MLFSCYFSLNKAYKYSIGKMYKLLVMLLSFCFPCSGTISDFLCRVLLCSNTVALYLHEQLLGIWLIVPVNLTDYSGEDSKYMKLDIFSTYQSITPNPVETQTKLS